MVGNPLTGLPGAVQARGSEGRGRPFSIDAASVQPVVSVSMVSEYSNQIPRHPDFHTVSWSTLGWYVDPLVGGGRSQHLGPFKTLVRFLDISHVARWGARGVEQAAVDRR